MAHSWREAHARRLETAHLRYSDNEFDRMLAERNEEAANNAWNAYAGATSFLYDDERFPEYGSEGEDKFRVMAAEHHSRMLLEEISHIKREILKLHDTVQDPKIKRTLWELSRWKVNV